MGLLREPVPVVERAEAGGREGNLRSAGAGGPGSNKVEKRKRMPILVVIRFSEVTLEGTILAECFG